jgi:hypothetical protein
VLGFPIVLGNIVATPHHVDDILEWTKIPTQNGDNVYLKRATFFDIYHKQPPRALIVRLFE